MKDIHTLIKKGESESLEEILSGQSTSYPRNKQIASIFKEAALIEKYGSGIKRVRNIMMGANAKNPLFELLGGFFKVTLFPSDSADIESTQKSTKEMVLESLKKDPALTRKELSRITGVSENAIKQHLASLKKQSIIKRVGSDRAGRWEVLRIE
jgi:ATP-dependent DNA helicase RecG